MTDQTPAQTLMVEPGTAIVYLSPIQLASVVSYGVVITMFDKTQNIGGLCHFIYPGADQDILNGKFCNTAIASQLSMLKNAGTNQNNLLINIYGASQHPEKNERFLQLAKLNYLSAVTFLKATNLKINAIDIGGEKGRKILFNTATGESLVASVSSLRESDWQAA